MQIDWFTTAAQIVNFLILVWLLKKFLYKPVLNAMERRQQRIAESLREAEERQSQADREKERYLSLQKEVEMQARQKIENAKAQADELRNDLFAEVKREVEASRSQWRVTLAQEKNTFLEQSCRLVTKQFELFATASLKELADKNLEETIIDVFWGKIKTGDRQAFDAVSSFVRRGEPVIITTAFVHPDQIKEKIKMHFENAFAAKTEIFFEVDESLVAGMALEAGGKKISWDIHHHLREFKGQLSHNLEKEINA